MQKRLYRSRRDRVLGGVSSGIAAYLGIDVVLVRIIWVILALAGGPGVIGYIICWIVIPEEPERKPIKNPKPMLSADSAMELPAEGGAAEEEGEEEEEEGETAARDGGRRAIGLFLIVMGTFFLLRRFSGVFQILLHRFIPGIYWHQFWNLARSLFWPSLLVVAGIILITGGLRGRKE